MDEQPQQKSTVAAITGLVSALPAQFILLLLINCVFLGTVFWYENNQTASRAALVGRILDACFERVVTPPK